MVHYYDMENDQISFGWEWPDNITLVGGAPTATTITGFVGLTVNHYAGQMLRVLDGNQKDVTYWVISNTATAMVVQGNGEWTPNKAANPIEATARVAVSTNGKIPTDRDLYIGNFQGGSGAEPDVEIRKHHGHGGNGIRLASSVNKIDFPGGKIPLSIQNPYIFFGIGKTKASGTLDVESTTINGAITAWDDTITVAAAGTLAIDDVIQISDTTLEDDPEIRKLTNVVGNVLTLNYPVSWAHSNGDAIKEVIAPFTYTVSHSRIPLRSMTLLHVYSDPYGIEPDLITSYQGNYLGKASFKGKTEDHVKADLDLWGMDSQVNPSGVTKPTVTKDTDDYFWWDDAELEYNSALVAIPNDQDFQWDNKLKWIRALGGHRDKKPYRIRQGVPEWLNTIKFNPVSQAIYNDREGGTERAGKITYTRSATDYMEFTLTDGRPTVKWPWKDEGPIDAELKMDIEETSLVIVSATAFY